MIPQQTLFNRFYSVSYKHKDNVNDIKIQYNQSIFDRDIVGVYGQYKYFGSVKETKVDDKISYMQNSFLRVGASYQKFEQKDITPNKDKGYEAISAFATNYNKLNLISNFDTIVTESIRYDKYTAFDNAFTGKVGIKQFLKHNFYISINGGTGYNAPTLGQLYGQFGANPNLKPEKSLTGDITLGNDTIWITGFYNEIKDLIDYQYPAGYVQTSGKSKIKGYEIGYEDYFANVLGVKALYTYLRTEDADGKSLARRPINQLDTTATYYVSDTVDVGINAQYIGTRYDKAGNEGAQTGKYIVANFVTNIEVNPKVNVYAKIDNITDKYYQTVDGYATAGRSLFIGLNAKY
jgi:vitamin B12 transporter